VLDESGTRMPGQLGVLFESEDTPSQRRGQSRFVSCSSGDDQRSIRAGNCRLLQQSGGNHRLHQVASAAERQILVDIGNGTKVVGYEKFAPYGSKGE